MIIAFFLIIIGVFFLFKSAFSKKKPIENKILSEGETLKNKYIMNHEKKIKDDAEYDEYLEWCKFKGELAVDKEGFNEYRMHEYQLYKKLLKHGISGIRK